MTPIHAIDLEIGDALFSEITEEWFVERNGWAPERVERVAERLQAGVDPADRLEVLVVWASALTAFTAPGRYIYFSRRLLERCPDDETAAFVVAHEIAHHALGHITHFPRWVGRLARVPGIWFPGTLIQMIERRAYGPERECEADRWALRLCADVGYDPEKCLRLFDILKRHLLDLRRDDLVYGPDESDQELSPDAPWAWKARMWVWQRVMGYLPVTDRVAALRRFVDGGGLKTPTRIGER